MRTGTAGRERRGHRNGDLRDVDWAVRAGFVLYGRPKRMSMSCLIASVCLALQAGSCEQSDNGTAAQRPGEVRQDGLFRS